MLDDLINSYVNQALIISRRLPRVTETERVVLERNKKFIKVMWRYK